MIVVYCTVSDREQAQSLVEGTASRIISPHGFSKVDHTATKAIIIGNHPKVEKAYRGIMPVEVVPKQED